MTAEPSRDRAAAGTDGSNDPLPTVSVIVPVYNQAEYVVGAVESVLAQRYSPVELIVVNDGSTDATADRLMAYRDVARIIHQENRGAAAALNRGIRESRGTLVCWLSADDEFLPGKLDAQVAAFALDPEAGIVHTGYERIDASGTQIDNLEMPTAIDPDPFVTVFWHNSINGSTVMLRRAIFDEVGPFDETLRADVDADMWLRILRRSRAVVVPGVFVRYRIHANSLSANTPLMAASMSSVRLRYLEELVRRLSLRRGAARTLARISAHLAQQGLYQPAARLRRESLRFGIAPIELVSSVMAEAASRMRRHPFTHRLGRAASRALRSGMRSPR